ncbi:Putative aliphatic sulfonates-binding protein precursor [Sporomusa ovata DSM 2662]|uniref:TRAP transporter solute receptor, TAXI family n=1 Tax=Sporomusa ovata TaxID=2378 RepID=A0A0U1L021_9FIRM|nr:TAXI family TRAP transporter solute-binding subunit [Sporomusa ovata]EQB27170.1 TRAP transporter solute receptor, TAXI family [Sporomusa ovata DSM 2662]CQR73006.1 TRAP transporter solute receptor, unknown substrate 1 [Sporomusa ovata]
MKKIVMVIMASMLVMSLLSGCGGEKSADQKAPAKKFINIATGGTAGVYYPLGGAIAEILNKNVPGANATAQSTGASVANINMLKDAKVELAMVQNDTAYYAFKGIEMFKDKQVANIRGVSTLYNETIQIIVLEDSPVKSINDLKGKKVAVGSIGSGTEANARQILEAYGLAYADLDPQYLSFGEAANGLKDGNVDAAFVTAGAPTAAIQDIAFQKKVRLIPVETDKAEALIKKYPFYAKQLVNANTYPGQGTDVTTVAVKAMLVVPESMDAETVYQITKAIYGNTDRLKAAHKLGEGITKETALEGMPIPVHPGAEKFFKEK